MRRLGWLIITGSVVSAMAQRLALDQLLNTMLTTRDSFGGPGMITNFGGFEVLMVARAG
jgi:hypothetical protein